MINFAVVTDLTTRFLCIVAKAGEGHDIPFEANIPLQHWFLILKKVKDFRRLKHFACADNLDNLDEKLLKGTIFRK